MAVLAACQVCGNLVPNGIYCDRHPRVSRSRRGYNERWREEAARFRIEFPYCGSRPNGQRPVMSDCFDKNLPTPAYCVDHVIPHNNDPRLMWDRESNWQSLCAQCHAKKTRAGL